MISNASQSKRNRIEANFERWIWRFRLINIIPVLMSLLGSISCFILGTQEELSAPQKLFGGYFDSEKRIRPLGKIVRGIDCYVIGIALLIFGYGVYELIISDIDPRLQDITDDRRNGLSINSLESLKQKLTNVIIVALVVTAFKLMIGFEFDSIVEVLQYCRCVLVLGLSDRVTTIEAM